MHVVEFINFLTCFLTLLITVTEFQKCVLGASSTKNSFRFGYRFFISVEVDSVWKQHYKYGASVLAFDQSSSLQHLIKHVIGTN